PGDAAVAVHAAIFERNAGPGGDFVGGRDFADGVVVGVADKKVSSAIEPEPDGAVETCVRAWTVGRAPSSGGACDGGHGAFWRDGADEVVAAVGYVDGVIGGNGKAERRIETRGRGWSILGAGLAKRAGDGGGRSVAIDAAN